MMGFLTMVTDFPNIYFFQDPLPTLLKLAPSADMLLMSDAPKVENGTTNCTASQINSGFMLLRNTATMRAFGKAFRSRLSNWTGTIQNDQQVLRRLLLDSAVPWELSWD